MGIGTLSGDEDSGLCHGPRTRHRMVATPESPRSWTSCVGMGPYSGDDFLDLPQLLTAGTREYPLSRRGRVGIGTPNPKCPTCIQTAGGEGQRMGAGLAGRRQLLCAGPCKYPLGSGRVRIMVDISMTTNISPPPLDFWGPWRCQITTHNPNPRSQATLASPQKAKCLETLCTTDV